MIWRGYNPSKTWLASEQSALDYETILELVAEKSTFAPVLIKKLNPDVVWTTYFPPERY